MVKLSFKAGLALVGLALLVSLIFAVVGLAADAKSEEQRLRELAQMHAGLLEAEARQLDQAAVRGRDDKRPIQPYRDDVRQRLRLLQSQARALGVDATFELFGPGERDGVVAAPQPYQVRQAVDLYGVRLTGHVDIRYDSAPGLFSMMGRSLSVKLLLCLNVLVAATAAALLIDQRRQTRRQVALAPAGLEALVHKLIDAGKASNDARLTELLDQHEALVSQIQQSAVGLESNTSHLREARLGAAGKPATALKI